MTGSGREVVDGVFTGDWALDPFASFGVVTEICMEIRPSLWPALALGEGFTTGIGIGLDMGLGILTGRAPEY